MKRVIDCDYQSTSSLASNVSIFQLDIFLLDFSRFVKFLRIFCFILFLILYFIFSAICLYVHDNDTIQIMLEKNDKEESLNNIEY